MCEYGNEYNLDFNKSTTTDSGTWFGAEYSIKICNTRQFFSFSPICNKSTSPTAHPLIATVIASLLSFDIVF